jgi:hypothetical protein
MGTLAVETASRDSAKTGAVVKAVAPLLGLTPGSAHQHIQRMRRELPLLVRAAYQLDRLPWLDWFLTPMETERCALVCGHVTGDIRSVLVKGAVDRTEDSAREAYLHAQDQTTAQEFDSRLEREQMAIVATRRFLRLRHPELVR